MRTGRPISFIAGITAAATTLLATSNAHALEIYGAWHCGNDFCTWSAVRDPVDFDQKNHWIIDRGDGKPSVNLMS